MSQPVVLYDGNYITCYPSSNAKDDGKLQLEFNMSRLVTRVTSKNFCITKPSFELSAVTDEITLKPVIKVGVGEASINGMDIIAKQELKIEQPETEGTYFLALKLARDSSNNVLGDEIYGSDTTFKGIRLSYYTEKDEKDKDILYLGTITWDGTQFTEVVEDEDKYGRIWAEDIMCKIEDPKHPEVSRLLLQEWLYKVPDWYFSKEGDVIYGSLEMLAGRDSKAGTGIKIHAVDDETSEIIIKAPNVDGADANRVMKLIGSEDGTSILMGKASIAVDEIDNYALSLLNEGNINLTSYDTIKLTGYQGVEIGSGGTGEGPKLSLKEHKVVLTDLNSTDLQFGINFKDEETILQTLGKAVWQYSDATKTVSLLQNNVDLLEVVPNALFKQDARIVDTLYLGQDDNLPQTTLSRLNWVLRENVVNGKTLSLTPSNILVTNPNGDGTSTVKLANSTDTQHSILTDNGKLELLNTTTTPSILFTDGSSQYNASIYKVKGDKKIVVDGILNTTGNIHSNGVVSAAQGITTNNGTITFVNGSNNATISKDNGSTTLRTSANLYVGSSGTAGLYAGNTTVKGSLAVGSSSQLKVDTAGNLNTSGTITGNQVFGAVYQDVAEVYEKEAYEMIEPMDIVFIRDDGKVSKLVDEENEDRVIGVVSENPFMVLGNELYTPDTRCVVALIGKVYVKTQCNDLRVGDVVKATCNGAEKVTDITKDFTKILGKVIETPKAGKVKIRLNTTM